MTPRRPGKPTLTPEQAARVREKIAEIQPIYGSVASLAEHLGISGPALSQIMHGKHTPSFAVAWGVAALGRVPFTELLGLREAPADLPADARGRALRRLAGLLPSEVEERLREEPDDDRAEEDWIQAALNELTLYKRERRRGAIAAPAPRTKRR